MLYSPPPVPIRRVLGIALGWWVSFGTAIGMALGYSAFASAMFGQFVRPISQQFGWTRSQTTGAFTVSALVTIAAAPLAGLLIDRFGPRRVLLFSATVLPFLIAALSMTDGSLARYYIIAGLIALLGAGTLPGTYTAISLTWFDRRRGIGSGIPIAGVGIANILLPPALQTIIPAFGWPTAFVAVGALMFVLVLPLAFFLFRLTPASPHELDGGTWRVPEAAVAPALAAEPLPPLHRQLLSRPFLQMAVIFMLLGISTLGVVINFQAMLQDAGLSAMEAAGLVSLHGLVMVVSRLGSGWLLDRFPPRLVAGSLLLCPIAGLAILAAGLPAAALVLAMILLPVGFGAEFDVMSYFVSRYFGRASFGRLYGCTYAAYVVGASIGPVVVSYAFDRWGTYRPGLLLLIALSSAATLLIFLLPPVPRVETDAAGAH